MVGKDGLGGNRASVRLYGGWNLNGIKYIDYHVDGTPFVLGGSLFYLGPGTNKGTTITTGTGNTGVPVEAAITTGYFFDPGLLAGVDGSVFLPDVLPNRNSLFWNTDNILCRAILIVTETKATSDLTQEDIYIQLCSRKKVKCPYSFMGGF